MASPKLLCSCLLPVLLIVLYCHHSSAVGGTYDEKCSTGLTADNKSLDDCDKEKNLKCLNSRCICQDPANQIWSARRVKINSRSKRGSKSGKSKGGLGKTILAGAAAGAAGGYIGGKLAQGGSSSGNGGSSSSGGSSGGSSKDRYELYYACHSRAGGQCVLDQYRHSDVVVTINNKPAEAAAATVSPNSSTTSTSHSPAGASDTTTSTSTTTAAPAAPVAAAQTSQITYDVSRMTVPKCIEFATCQPSAVKIVNGTVVSGSSDDPRIGHCVCKDGYKSNNLDVCVKTNGAGRETQMSFFIIFVTTFISLYYK